MLRAISSFMQKPRIVIPVAFVIALAIGLFEFGRIGRAPSTAGLEPMVAVTAAHTGTLSLAFNATGRVSVVNVALGDKVELGEVLASLDTTAAEASVAQAKGALDLAKAQAGSMSVQYDNAKSSQDTLVENAYHTLLSAGLEALPSGSIDESHNPIISGTYSCDKEGSYTIEPYTSATRSGFSFNVHGLEEVNGGEVTYGTPQALGACGLFVTFVPGFAPSSKWVVNIPNTTSASYQANKNAYGLALATRSQVLSQLSANLGQNGSTSADVSAAAVSAAEGAYDAALAALQNEEIMAPESGTVSFIDPLLKVGQSVTAGHSLISITD